MAIQANFSKLHIPIKLTEIGLKGNGWDWIGVGVGPKTFVIHT